MRGNGRFLLGLGGVALIVTWLIWTGFTSTMLYYLTPAELLANVAKDPGLHEAGLKVSGRVVVDSYSAGEDAEGPFHRFSVEDLELPDHHFTVVYRDPLPDNFRESGEVVVEGRYGADQLFRASMVLTKCGSRYEAIPEGATAIPPGEAVPNVSGSDGASGSDESGAESSTERITAGGEAGG